jgi:hypothetical protein
MRLFLLLCLLVPISALISWNAVGSNRNVLIATSKAEGILLSSDGVTWAKSAAPSLPWNSISMSSNGKTLAATAGKQGLYLSKDFGKEWNKVKGLEATTWVSAKLSNTGSLVLGCTENGVHRSTNSGETFDMVLNVAGHWNAMYMDETGRYAAVVGLTESVYVTKDFGKTWAPADISASHLIDVTGDKSAKQLYTAGLAEGIFASSNRGATWEKTSAPDLMWSSITTDATGSIVVAAAADEAIYFSTNYGQTWKKSDSPSNKKWQKVMTRDDGNVYAFVQGESNVYLSEDNGAHWTKLASETAINGASKNFLKSFGVEVTSAENKAAYTAAELTSRDVHLETATDAPTETPTEIPTGSPTAAPTAAPSAEPTYAPTAAPTATPTYEPTAAPSVGPTFAPSAVPTQTPSVTPSAVPTIVPTATPSAVPTYQPSVSFAPTVAPTYQTQPIVQYDATYKIRVDGTALTDNDKKTICQTIFQTTVPKPDYCEIVAATFSRRRLNEVKSLVAGNAVAVTARLEYNLIQYPTLTVATLTQTVVAALQTAVETHAFGNALTVNADANDAIHLLDATVEEVTTVTSSVTSPPPQNNDNGLSSGSIAAIVICSIVGLALLLFIIYWYAFYDEKMASRISVRLSQPMFTVRSRDQKRQKQYAVSEVPPQLNASNDLDYDNYHTDLVEIHMGETSLVDAENHQIVL